MKKLLVLLLGAFLFACSSKDQSATVINKPGLDL
jgi:hypothetical protein